MTYQSTTRTLRTFYPRNGTHDTRKQKGNFTGYIPTSYFPLRSGRSINIAWQTWKKRNDSRRALISVADHVSQSGTITRTPHAILLCDLPTASSRTGVYFLSSWIWVWLETDFKQQSKEVTLCYFWAWASRDCNLRLWSAPSWNLDPCCETPKQARGEAYPRHNQGPCWQPQLSSRCNHIVMWVRPLWTSRSTLCKAEEWLSPPKKSGQAKTALVSKPLTSMVLH